MTFNKLGLERPILDALIANGYETPTPIQTKAIPPILQGRDVVGLAQTGTGKTAAFALPLLQRAAGAGPSRLPRVLILSPTRELAAQIRQSVKVYGRNLRLTSLCVVGGVKVQPQKRALNAGIDILVATPGRLLDLVDQKALRLNAVETLVIDEADQMLDIGFLPDIRRIIARLPADRQTLLFSATMPKEIRALSAAHMRNPIDVSVAPPAATADRINESVMHLPPERKINAVADLIRLHTGKRVIVFTRTKRGADKVARKLSAEGHAAAAIHGNKSQAQRVRALNAFRDGSSPILIATDIAARGIDVADVELVVNFELPNVPEVYIHRIGRTARAGASGLAVSLCAADESGSLRDIERLIRRRIPVVGTHAGDPDIGGEPPRPPHAPKRRNNRPNRRRRSFKPSAAAAMAAAQ